MRQCLAEANEPYPYPDTGDKSTAQDRSSTSSVTASGNIPGVSNRKEEEAGDLQQKINALSQDAANKQALVAKLQSQLDQLVQQLAEKRDAISDLGASSNRPLVRFFLPYTTLLVDYF